MADPVAPLAYADLDRVRTLIGRSSESGLNAVLSGIDEGVSALISAPPRKGGGGGLGVRWDGTTAGEAGQVIREVNVLNGACYLTVPVYEINGVYAMEQLVTYEPLIWSVDDGWYRSVRLTGNQFNLTGSVGVIGRWADLPGGPPPSAVVSFATFAVAQEWRRQTAGHSGISGPDGYVVTTDNAWRAGDQWKRLRETYLVPRLGVI